MRIYECAVGTTARMHTRLFWRVFVLLLFIFRAVA
jgi:hypothetical protein